MMTTFFFFVGSAVLVEVEVAAANDVDDDDDVGMHAVGRFMRSHLVLIGANAEHCLQSIRIKMANSNFAGDVMVVVIVAAHVVGARPPPSAGSAAPMTERRYMYVPHMGCAVPSNHRQAFHARQAFSICVRRPAWRRAAF